jgi:hypothetical protein
MSAESAPESLAPRATESRPAYLAVRAYTAGVLSVRFDMRSETPMRDARDGGQPKLPAQQPPQGDDNEL